MGRDEAKSPELSVFAKCKCLKNLCLMYLVCREKYIGATSACGRAFHTVLYLCSRKRVFRTVVCLGVCIDIPFIACGHFPAHAGEVADQRLQATVGTVVVAALSPVHALDLYACVTRYEYCCCCIYNSVAQQQNTISKTSTHQPCDSGHVLCCSRPLRSPPASPTAVRAVQYYYCCTVCSVALVLKTNSREFWGPYLSSLPASRIPPRVETIRSYPRVH